MYTRLERLLNQLGFVSLKRGKTYRVFYLCCYEEICYAGKVAILCTFTQRFVIARVSLLYLQILMCEKWKLLIVHNKI